MRNMFSPEEQGVILTSELITSVFCHITDRRGQKSYCYKVRMYVYIHMNVYITYTWQ